MGRRVPFDQRTLARQALEEAEAFLRSIDLPPEIDQRGYVESKKHDHPIPSERALTDVLEETFYASLASEEGRPCRLRLVYDGLAHATRERDDSPSGATVHWFADPIALDRDALRRLSPVHDAARGALHWREHESGALVAGVGAPAVLGAGARPEFMISAPTPAHLIIGYYDRALVAHRRGETFLRRECALPDLQRLSAFLGSDFGEAAALMPRAAMAIADEGHGGSLWVAGGDAAVCGTRLNYRVHTAGDLASRPNLEGRRASIHSLGKLASTDGAVLIDTAGRLLGFGAFYVGPAPSELDLVLVDGSTIRASFASLGGGRHQAAAAFCAANAPAAALVVSQDAQITVMTCESRSLPRVAEVAPFGRESGA